MRLLPLPACCCVVCRAVDCYVKDRVARKERPVTFRLVGARRIENAALSRAFEERRAAQTKQVKDELAASGGGGGGNVTIKVARGFHGLFHSSCSSLALRSLLRSCVLVARHPPAQH